MSQQRLDHDLGATGLYRELLGSDIRLLRIHAGNDGDEMRCHLEQIPLDSRPKYFALSYIWGGASVTRSILVNGRQLDVRENLYDALCHIRSWRHNNEADLSSFIWIDALCINQDNIDERSQQVTRITNIYAMSDQVIIWLGLCDEETDEDIGKLFRGIPASTLSLGERAWFHRIWTVQEACLGAEDPILSTGRHWVPMKTMCDFLAELPSEETLRCRSPLIIASIRKLFRPGDPVKGTKPELRDGSKGLAQLFVDVLCILGGFKATNPLDQLYGLLGLVGSVRNEQLPDELRPDYSAKIEFVYERYATYFLNQTGDLRLLHFPRSELKDVPSWVTDFRYLKLHRTSRACRTAHVWVKERTLFVRGFIIGTCVYQLYSDDTINTTSECLARFRLFEKDILGSSANLKQTITEVALQRWLSVFFPQMMSRMTYHNLINDLGTASSDSKVSTSSPTLEAFLDEFVLSTWLVTDKGEFFSATSSMSKPTQEGDLICLFQGSHYPSIIRRTASHRYQYVCPGSGTVYDPKVQFDDAFWAGSELETFELI